MRKSLQWMVAIGTVAGALVVVGMAGAAARASAADPVFTGKTIAQARFERFNVRVHYEFPAGFGGSEADEDDWTASQRTSGPSDLYVQSNTWDPGASTGWHTHPGHSLIIVQEGEITAYDENCQKQVFKSAAAGGSGLVDANHVHMIRNEGLVTARATVVQLVPAGAPRKTDQPAPCSP